MRPPTRSPWPALAAFGAAAVVLTWPLALHLGDRLPAGANDLFQNYWNFWWWRTAVFERGQIPYHTDLLFFPEGASLAFHTHSEANILLSFPVLYFFGPGAALNFSTLVGFAVAGWGAYLLAREYVEDSRAAFAAGLVFAYFPQHFEQSLEHLNLASYGLMPLVLLALRRAVRTGSRRAWAGASAIAALNSLFSLHQSVLLLPGALALFAVELRRAERPRKRVVVEALAAALLAAIFLLPFLWPMVAELWHGDGSFRKPEVDRGIDLLFLVVPAAEHPLWGSLFAPLYERWRHYRPAGFVAYLGVVSLAALALPLGALVTRRLKQRSASSTVVEPAAATEPRSRGAILFWGLFFLGYLVLALGDELRVAGTATGVPLPFAFLRRVPVLESVRVANRFLVPAMLGLAVLVAWGALQAMRASRRPALVAAGLSVLVVLDFLFVPFPLRELPRPKWIDALGRAPAGAVLNLPGGYRARAAEDMYLQTLHRRRLVGGYVSVTPRSVEDLLVKHPVLRLAFEGRPQIEADVRQGLERFLAEVEVAVVIVHLQRTRERLEALEAQHRGREESRLYDPERGIAARRLEEFRAALRELWGTPFHGDGDVEIYVRPQRN